MKIAAVNALVELTRESVPEIILEKYKLDSLEFGKNYIIPTPFDPRLKEKVSYAVAQAAIDSGVARLMTK